jgi:hypothetical protein
MRDLFGGQQGKPQSAFDLGGSSGSPWSTPSRDSSLAQEAGLGDIGSGRTAAYDEPASQRTGLFDVAQNDAEDFDSDFDGDFGDTA